jgi:hypothetical protein
VADDVAAGVVDTIAPPLVEAVPVLEPVVQPISDLVTGVSPLPVSLPSLPDAGAILADSTTVLADSPLADQLSAAKTFPGVAGDTVSGSPALPAALARTSASPGGPTTIVGSADPALPDADDPPYAALDGPGSGSGSGVSPSGPSGSAAWLNDFDLEFLLPGTFPVIGSSAHAPSPVSFDPGSSPD